MKKIVFCTLRDNKGATGGPGGVLFLQKSVLGNRINGLPCQYWFNYFTPKLGILKRIINEIIFYFKIQTVGDAYFFTHDIRTGAILARMGKKYSMIYHHQGPIIQEMKNMGYVLSERKYERIRRDERIALTKANTLHFPANGAVSMYFDSPLANCKYEETNVQPALYNIIPFVEPQEPQEFELKADIEKITLFSLGTLTKAKGQDLVVDFLGKHIEDFHKPVRYIIVGKGPLKDVLLNKLDLIKQNHSTFEYYYYEGVPHDTVMYIHKISDVYIMLHRISIFDFATLEAMSQKSAVILSKVGGNKDFNLNNNILYAEDIENDHSLLANCDLESLKNKNLEVFDKFFSKEAFKAQYEKLLSSVAE